MARAGFEKRKLVAGTEGESELNRGSVEGTHEGV